MSSTAFQLVQTLYWSGLATWFGLLIGVAIIAPVIFRVVREHDPTLPTVLSVNLDAQHSTLLSSTVVARILEHVSRVAVGCAGAVMVGLILQAIAIHPPAGTPSFFWLVLRIVLFVAATAVLVYDWRILGPRVLAARQEFIDHADEPDRANAAKDVFDRLSRDSVNVMFCQAVLLLGLILASANIFYPGMG